MRPAVPFVVIIPARYASTRLPGKPLADIGGKPMVVRVAQRVKGSGASGICVATDHLEVAAVCQAHGFEAIMTRADHVSGTDRLAEAAMKLRLPRDSIVVNVQGDEPMMSPSLIRAVAALLHDDKEASVATACCPIRDTAEMFNPNAVKVVLARDGAALYFSRAPIPWHRDSFSIDAAKRAFVKMPRGMRPGAAGMGYRHIGIYAYRASFLFRYAALTPAPQENAEALEQLRAELERQETSVKEAKQAIRDREQFLDESETKLFEKVQAQQEKEIEQDQKSEDLRGWERRLKEREAALDPQSAAALKVEDEQAKKRDEFNE